MPENRAFPRTSKTFDVQYVLRGTRHAGITIDVSITGLFIYSEELPAVGEKIVIDLLSPAGDILHLDGRVARIQRPPAELADSIPTGFGVALLTYIQAYERLVTSASPPEERALDPGSGAASPAGSSLGLVRILLVDQAEQNFRFVGDLFSRIDTATFKVEWAPGPRQGIAALKERRHDVCLVSSRLKPEGERTFLVEARESGCEIPMVVLTSQHFPDLTAQAIRDGATDTMDETILDCDRLDRCIRSSLEKARAQAQMRDLYDQAPCGYYTLDAEGSFVRINDTALAWLGYSRRELVGTRKAIELLTPASTVVFAKRYRWFLERGRLKDLEMDFIRKDGTLLPVLSSATLVRSGAEKPSSTWSLLDLTDRKRSDVALRRLVKAVESIELGLIVKDVAGKILFVNSAAAAMNGYAPEEMIGKNAQMLSPKEQWRSQSEEEARNMKRWSRESRNLRKDGTVFPVRLITDVVKDAFGKPMGIVTWSEDLSQLK
jgi:PAS domain S-box-containing protein